MIRLLLADDHKLFRQGLARLVNDHADLSVVAEASNYAEVIDAVRTASIDVAILDLSMPGRGGIELIGHVKSLRPSIRILVMTMHDEERYISQALRAGAEGYMVKENAADALYDAIRRLHTGGRYLCAQVAERLAISLAEDRDADRGHELLSDREFTVFEMLIAGKRGCDIAQELCLSEKTVSTHKNNVLRKINVPNQAELVRYAIRNRLTTL
jgi:DNA-binding NarL/FixJ family response regulator